MSATRVKLVLVASDPQPRDDELRPLFRRLAAAYAVAAANPFRDPGGALESPTFDASVRAIVTGAA